MKLSVHAVVPRVWTVELRPHAAGALLACLRCAPRTIALPGSGAQAAALQHLAAHARRDQLAAHLRTCQCRQRECRWHARHRGCAGPVLLVLSRDPRRRSWRLADTCAACAHATPHAAVVPETTPAPPSDTQRRSALPERSPALPPGTRVREMLSYLTVALPACSSAQARLMAVQCALRADTQGRTRLSRGVLRGMRLRQCPFSWRELSQANWLRPTPREPGALEFQLLDPAVLSQAPGRRARAQAADWALRQSCRPAVRDERPIARLVTLYLATCPAEGDQGCVDLGHLARAVGLSTLALAALLDQLVAGGALLAWRLDVTAEEIHFTLGPYGPG
ncbi:hypothetical protein [Streptomyces nigrescens]|uniref:hypothetical protein n=1 Tax=Streptomyces nigrescens TaxID=1920 RepID=UPI003695A8AA